jgi:methylmalonyl-CoA/ethylmalonyl-CoA epimerase
VVGLLLQAFERKGFSCCPRDSPILLAVSVWTYQDERIFKIGIKDRPCDGLPVTGVPLKQAEITSVWDAKMIGRLNHVAIAVPDLEAASAQYRSTLGADVGPPQDEPDHGVTVVFITLPNTKIELLYPLGENSPIAGFLDKNPSGGIHHICYEVDDILTARDHLLSEGARVLGTGEPKIGAHGKPVLFLHPKDFNGCLVELEQV